MSIKLLAEPHLGFLGLTGGCAGSSGSAPVKVPLCFEATCYGSYYLSIVIYASLQEVLPTSSKKSRFLIP